MMHENLVGIGVYGEDKPGIVAEISGILARSNINIIDIEQNVLQGIFFMFLVADISHSEISISQLRNILRKKAGELKLEVNVVPFSYSRERARGMHVMTVIGRDRVGIVHDISSILYELGINIEKMSLKARGDLISIEFFLDMRGEEPERVKKLLKERIEKSGLDAVIQPEWIYRKKKRLIVFDMDSTIVENEIINELAKEAGVENEVMELTKEAMDGQLDFDEALRKRVRLLKGLDVEVLERIFKNIKLTPGVRELIASLKAAGYKTAIVSSGFSYFTDRLKNELGFDYAFGNELEIKNGKLTGNIRGKIINARVKAEIIEELARIEGISRDDIVAVGDGANDTLMIKHAGLGVAFNAKSILKEISDGSISKNNFIGLATVLNLPSEFRKRVED